MLSYTKLLSFAVLCCSGLIVECTVPSSNETKVGQCPYIQNDSTNCEFNCKSDSACEGSEKCCSNGCGTQCMKPLNFTMCEHMRLVAQHHVDHSQSNSNFVPKCNEDGTYQNKQCDLLNKECWCVDFRGFEISQTRTEYGNALECSDDKYPRNCPLFRCKHDCEYGIALDSNGCRSCRCIDPCSSINCLAREKSCRLLQVYSRGWPCPPVPLCLPSPNNPCLYGTPLKMDNGSVVCDSDTPCPYSHMCRTNGFSNRGFCCPQKGKCLPLKCDLTCRYGYAYDSNECPICECHEPCKTAACQPPTTCKVIKVQCFRAPCPPIASCE